MSVSKVCRHCSKEFSCKPSSTTEFCSRECLNVHKVTCTCEVCHVSFTTFAVMEKRAKYCSNFCRSRSGPVKKVCQHCKADFRVRSLRDGDAKYCSFRCNMESKRKMVSCETCGTAFTRVLSSKSRFCSVACSTVSLQKRIEKKCEFCHKIFHVKESHGHQSCCSKKCSNATLLGRRDYPEPESIPGSKWLQLGNNKFTLVDESDYNTFTCRTLTEHKGYALLLSHQDGKSIKSLLHRIIMDAPEGVDIDHINCNKLDNRRSNLRFADRSKNAANTFKKENTSSRFRGVSWNKNSQKWVAYIRINKRMKYLGNFVREEEAACAYDNAAREYFKEFARLNFPIEDERSALSGE